ncbi:BON domain-containing protein [Roseateles chitosanitabidus]|jgi:osmotically-inducible protein OsmY|uniref:BON domain-containing protein n=1 Tax=Roseateles chitosanitabidus TaxID=65048 RepID=UPI000832FA68|nr:BON domain-containing protein [Roseateles chitosanitabidus]
MMIRATVIALATAVGAITMLPGCAVTRGQSSVGEYVDDAGITASVKSKFVENKAVDATSIHVETLQGEVMLSGFAKNADEKASAERLAREVKGVKRVKNEIAIRN